MLHFRFFPILAATFLLAGSPLADSLRDPTGCTTGSAVANCRKLPPLGSSGGGSSLDRGAPTRSPGLSSGDRLRKSSPLPSEGLQNRGAPGVLPPPGSTGLGGGSTGLGH
jgi:hypothetical protein